MNDKSQQPDELIEDIESENELDENDVDQVENENDEGMSDDENSTNSPNGNGDLKIGTIEESKFGKIRHTSIVSEMEKSYLDYAMSVIVSRALPDVRDGLKPVHRRILFSMFKSGIHHNSAYKKSARIVGDVLGKYHPHGDAPVYMAMVRLAQDFSMRYELIDGQGNFGSVDGDSPAAMRYTEARLAKISQELLADINKQTVNFVDNFDGSLQEPTVLPSKLPNLLLMGSEGIAVGMATKIPPHNLKEVCTALIEMIKLGSSEVDQEYTPPNLENISLSSDSPAIDTLLNTDPKLVAGTFSSEIVIDQIMEHINGPDFPTAGIIYDFDAIKKGYQTGKGRVVIRAKAKIEENSKGSFQIVITELPYQVNKAKLLIKIADLVRNKRIAGIRNLRDDSDRTGLQVTIELKRDARPKVVLNKLFKYSDLQSTFSMNMVALNSTGVPQLMNVRQILQEYIAHRQLVVVKRSQYELSEARARAHILEGLIIALNNLDDVIDTIRKSKDTQDAHDSLMKKFGLSDLQATAILEMITLYDDERRTKLVRGKIGEFMRIMR